MFAHSVKTSAAGVRSHPCRSCCVCGEATQTSIRKCVRDDCPLVYCGSCIFARSTGQAGATAIDLSTPIGCIDYLPNIQDAISGEFDSMTLHYPLHVICCYNNIGFHVFECNGFE